MKNQIILLVLFLCSNIFVSAQNNVGIGTSTPLSKLDVIGNTRTTNFQMTSGAMAGWILQSDATGNAVWIDPATLSGAENDPQVSSTTSNYHPKWNGSTLVDGAIYDNGSIGIGTTTPSSLLQVAGTTTTTNFKMTNGAVNGYVFQSDASGNATWVNPTSLSITETDPQVSSSTSNYHPKWNGSTLVDGVIYDNGNVGIGTTTPSSLLQIAGTTTTTNFKMTNGAVNGYVFQSDASGNASWVNPTSLPLTETDPQVSSTTTGYHPKWNGTTLVDGIIYDNATNIGIGTSSPTAKLHVSGGIRMTSGITGNDGTASSPAYSYNSDTDIGMFRAAANQLAFSTGGAERLRINASGNLGIGTTTPTEKLEVSGKTKTTDFQMTTGAVAGYYLQSDASGNATWVGSSGAVDGSGTVNYLSKWIGTTLLGNSVVYDDGVNVGIGTSSPANIFSVVGKSSFGGNNLITGAEPLEIQGVNAGISIQSRTAGDDRFVLYAQDGTLRISEGGDHFFIQQNTGYLGLGMSIPENRVDIAIYARTNTHPTALPLYITTDLQNNSGGFEIRESDGTEGVGIGNNSIYAAGNNSSGDLGMRAKGSNGLLFFTTNNNIKMQIMPSGNVGINTITPAFKLEVNGSAAKPGGGSWTNSSDRRLKQNIQPYSDGLSSLLKISPVTFQYNELSGFDTEPVYVGVIAQELQEVAPYMVGTIEREGMESLTVDNSAMMYMLINSVKEQQQMIDELKKEIEILKNK